MRRQVQRLLSGSLHQSSLTVPSCSDNADTKSDMLDQAAGPLARRGIGHRRGAFRLNHAYACPHELAETDINCALPLFTSNRNYNVVLRWQIQRNNALHSKSEPSPRSPSVSNNADMGLSATFEASTARQSVSWTERNFRCEMSPSPELRVRPCTTSPRPRGPNSSDLRYKPDHLQTLEPRATNLHGVRYSQHQATVVELDSN